MEPPVTAVYDANVLYTVPLRDLCIPFAPDIYSLGCLLIHLLDA